MVHYGEQSTNMFFVVSGLIAVQQQLGDGRILRLKTMTQGSVIGEIGFYLGINRTADMVALMPSQVYCLSMNSFQKMQKEHPELVTFLHEWIVAILAERLAEANQTIENLLE